MNDPLANVVLFHIGPVPITQILVVSWGVMGAVILFAAALRLRLRVHDPGRPQQVIEAMLSWLGDEIRGIVDRDPWPFIPVVATLFIFILTSNLLALISSLVPGLKPPTADIATTAALATVVFLAVPFYGVAMTGGQGSMSKLKAGDVAMWATTELMDLVGPAAASSPLEKWFRDAKIYQIYEGATEIQKMIIVGKLMRMKEVF